MLSEKQLEAASQIFYERMQQVNAEYLAAIGKRFKELRKIKESDQVRLTRLMEWSLTDSKKITRSLSLASGKNVADVNALLEEIARDNYDFAEPFYNAKSVDYVKYADNAELKAFVEGAVRDTQGTLANLTRTTSVQGIYKDALDAAALHANLGVENYNRAIRSVMREVAKYGIHKVEYASGHRRRLDSAVRQNILASMKSTNLRSAELIGSQFGNDGWEVSYHSRPRPSHRSIGGRRYGLLDFESSGAAAKLMEHGCLHYKFPVIMGVSARTYDKKWLAERKAEDERKFEYEGKEYDSYSASQLQRRIERKIRYEKDLWIVAHAAGDTQTKRECKSRISALTREYAKFSNAANLPTRRERTVVSGYRGQTGRKTGTSSAGSPQQTPAVTKSATYEPFKGVEASYSSVLTSRYAEGSELAKSVYRKYVREGGNNVIYYDGVGIFEHTDNGGTISLNSKNDTDATKGLVWFHEHGHWVDFYAGKSVKGATWFSVDDEFRAALNEDAQELEEMSKKHYKTENLRETREKVSESIVKYGWASSGLQDILSGIHGAPYPGTMFSHSEEYWKEDKDNVLIEAFASMFEAEFSKGMTKKLIKGMLPRAWQRFQELLKEIDDATD